jgi:hypothetical protein
MASELNIHFSNEVIQMAKKYTKMFKIFSHLRNANENYIDIASHFSQGGYH